MDGREVGTDDLTVRMVVTEVTAIVQYVKASAQGIPDFSYAPCDQYLHAPKTSTCTDIKHSLQRRSVNLFSELFNRISIKSYVKLVRKRSQVELIVQ